MTANEAHRALLVRAFETPLSPPWTEADAAWASAEAARAEGEQAEPDRYIARRAQLAFERLAAREPAVSAALAVHGAHAGWTVLALAIAFCCGLALDAIGAAQRLNIVALPMLGVLGWNLVVYALLGLAALRGSGTALGAAWSKRLSGWTAPRRASAALRRYRADAAAANAPLDASRLAFLLHAGAAALAAGLLVSMYARGLAFEYRAGWDSTFLSADQVHHLLSVVLWPALTLTGQALPPPDQIAALRFSVGPGENAARWIHWTALTVALVVLLPRAALAARAALRARTLARDFPLDLQAPYFRRLLPQHGAAAASVQVLPYSYRLAPELLPGLQAVLRQAFGAHVDLQVAEPLPVGSEDDLARHLPPAVASTRSAASATAPATESGHAAQRLRVPLFALTATPERETHAAFLHALAALGGYEPGQEGFDVLVDESAFRSRFDATRLAQRRAAWQALLTDAGRRALFVDLAQPDSETIATDLALAMDRP